MRSTRWLLACAWLMACTDSKDTPDDTDSDSDTEDSEPAGWTAVAEHIPSAIMSITGTDADNVWAVGTDEDLTGPQVLHWDGAAWSRHDVASPGDLWWGWMAGADDVWMVGAGGRVIHYTPSTQTADVEQLDVNPDDGGLATLFGIWGSGPDDIWTVGGNIDVGSNGAEVWHYDGTSWTLDTTIPAAAAGKAAMYKVWGSGPDDVWICGMGGVVIHWDGTTWTEMTTGTTTTLFTLHGTSSSDVYVVGGAGNATIVHWDGSTWTDESPLFVETMQGVNTAGDVPVAVGWGGAVYERGEDGTWTQDARGRGTFQDFHAVWTDDDGGMWAVGGAIRGSSTNEGVIVYGGPTPPATYTP